MKQIAIVTLGLLLIISSAAGATKAPGELIDEAVQVLQEIAEQPDAEHFRYVLQNTRGVAVFPSVLKAGLGLGGRYGEGVVLKYDPSQERWYGPYFVQLKGISYGLQIGVQKTSLVLVMTAEEGLRSLEEGQITLGGNLSVAAGPLGRSAEAGTNLTLDAVMYSYSISKGAFIGASLEGASIDNSVNANQVYWNQELTPAEMLARPASNRNVRNLIRELERMMAGEAEVSL
ncbi:MAG: lipid-binding SYLF domain-containing protein [Bacillota bacterium]|jgi:lipid-binding SYLF domain-containing protein|nr:lipid-binding SYLF domain-containing protein [Bacillota bacterium]HHT91331.1 lipid-binding SYLF domain-containing protein [Bacillota bacterium]